MRTTVLCFAVLSILLQTCVSDLGMVAINVDSDPEKDGSEMNKKLSADELSDLQDISKQISHSKGPLTYTENGDAEVRRSISRKIVFEAENRRIEKILSELKSSHIPPDNHLQDLEYFVHKYETAIDFMNRGGMEIVINFTKSENSSTVNEAFLVLAAAMQGNPEVQKYAAKLGFVENLLSDVTTWPIDSRSSILAVVSSYIRLIPQVQETFYEYDGILRLAECLKSETFTLNQKLKIISLLSDLAVELYGNAEDNHSKQEKRLKRLFADSIQASQTCSVVSSFLAIEAFIAREKVITAMKSLFPVCKKEFLKPSVAQNLQKLLSFYNPELIGNNSMDLELKNLMFDELQELVNIIKESRKSTGMKATDEL